MVRRSVNYLLAVASKAKTAMFAEYDPHRVKSHALCKFRGSQAQKVELGQDTSGKKGLGW